jgi:hypothetical protein
LDLGDPAGRLFDFQFDIGLTVNVKFALGQLGIVKQQVWQENFSCRRRNGKFSLNNDVLRWCRGLEQ